MTNLETTKDLFGHMQWADAKVWRVVLDNQKAREDAKLRSLLYHLHVVQRAFLKVWRGESFAQPFPQFTETLEVLEWSSGYYDEARAYIGSLTDDELDRPQTLPWPELVADRIGREPASATVGQTAMQVAMHSTYHRGQVNAQLRQLGFEPPLVDFITWIWLDKPAPDSL